MDSWFEIQLKKMEAGGNDKLNAFFAQYGIPKETNIIAKYNSNAAKVYRDRIFAITDGRPWWDPLIVKESIAVRKPALGGSGGGGWDNDDSFRSTSNNGYDIRRNQSDGDFRYNGNENNGFPVKSRSSGDIYTRAELEASAANKDDFFARKLAENESKPEGLPPAQGGKYVGFGSSPNPMPRSNSQGDVFSVVSQGMGKLSLVAQSAANVVQEGTKEITSKVREGGYDHRVNETVTAVTAKTTEISHKTWGIMKGVMAMASKKVEEYTKETGVSWNMGNPHQTENERNGYYQDFGNESKGWNNTTTITSAAAGQSSSGRQLNSVSSGSWDDWDDRKEGSAKGVASSRSNDDWAGWDDPKDDGYDSFYRSSSDSKSSGHKSKAAAEWGEGGFL